MDPVYILSVEHSSRPAIADLAWWDEPFDAWCIHRINVPVPARGLGYGKKLLERICQDADYEGVNLILAPEPSGGLSMKDLVAWYKRHGFEWTRSRAMMERKPR